MATSQLDYQEKYYSQAIVYDNNHKQKTNMETILGW